MIFVTHMKNAKAAKDYFAQHLAPGDYYAKEATELKGQWQGRGAAMLGLAGEVRQEDYFRLCENRHPDTGQQLTPRTKEDRRVLTDFTFDAPKSVSLACELGGDDGNGDARILDAFQYSVRETMAEIEQASQTRIRARGNDSDRNTGTMIWSEHIHRTTRPVDGIPDCQLHCHATVFNATYDDSERRWKAIQLGDIVRDKGYYQAAFHARLANRLAALGYGIEKDGNSFRLAGIDKALTDAFSRRTALIESEAARLGIHDAKAKGQLGRRTREKKTKVPQSITELRAEWKSRLTPEEHLSIGAARGMEGNAPITPDQAKAYALDHAFQNASVVSIKRLQSEALTYAMGSVTPDQVADLPLHKEVITETRGGQVMATTRSVLRDEIAMLQFAKDGQRKCAPLVDGSQIHEYALEALSGEQRKAAVHVLESRNQVTGIVGKAGTGKTRMMRATVDAIHAGSDKKVFTFAPSSQASRGVLAKEGFTEATTLETLLRSEKMQEQVRGQVIWVDEAGLVSSKDMRRLMEVAKKGNSRVILSGDYTQHASVEAGDAFRLLEKEAGVRLARLTEVRRQIEPGYKKAVEAISQGSGIAAQKGFDALDKMGSIVEATGEDRHRLLVRDYLMAAEDGRTALIIAPTHAEGGKLTEALRDALKASGRLGEEHAFIVRKSTSWTDAQKGDARNYQPGMVVEFQQNVSGFTRGDKAVVVKRGNGISLVKENGTQAALPLSFANRFEVYQPREIAIAKGDRIRITRNGEARVDGQAKGTRVNNGDIYTVEGFSKEGDIRIGKGKLLPKGWGHFTFGYVDTSYASQGKTVDRVFIATGRESLGAANQQQWYVSTTRGREMARIYVDDKREVRDAIARTGERLSAVELTQTTPRPSWRDRFHASWERNRVRGFLKARADAIGKYWNDRGRRMESYG